VRADTEGAVNPKLLLNGLVAGLIATAIYVLIAGQTGGVWTNGIVIQGAGVGAITAVVTVIISVVIVSRKRASGRE
jgi:hypothetical protein